MSKPRNWSVTIEEERDPDGRLLDRELNWNTCSVQKRREQCGKGRASVIRYHTVAGGVNFDPQQLGPLEKMIPDLDLGEMMLKVFNFGRSFEKKNPRAEEIESCI